MLGSSTCKEGRCDVYVVLFFCFTTLRLCLVLLCRKFAYDTIFVECVTPFSVSARFLCRPNYFGSAEKKRVEVVFFGE